MRVIYEKLPSKKINCVATIGAFDGIHLGHQFILKKLLQLSVNKSLPSLVITFDVPPKQFLSKTKKVSSFKGCISDFDEKITILRSLGIDCSWFLKTNKKLLESSARSFIDYIFNYFNIKKLIVGEDFHFGHGASTHAEYLKKLKKTHNFKICIIRRKKKNNTTISSSLIRGFISNGQMEKAKTFLGRNFSLKGQITKGRGVGMRLGFPTANLSISGSLLPEHGVYAGYVIRGKKTYLAAINIGLVPTLTKRKNTKLEAHLINFRGNLLGKQIKIVFIKKIRNEHKFRSPDELKRAIKKDIHSISSKYSSLPLKHPQLVVV